MSDTDSNYSQLLSDELFNLSRSESLSEEGLREIIECDHQLRLNNDNHHLVSDYDFFLEACINERFNEEIIECLLEYFPAAASAAEEDGASPLYFACGNSNVTLNIIQLLIDAAPDSVRSVESNGRMPLHNLCTNRRLDERAALEILKLLIEMCPEAVRHEDQRGCLPVHIGGGFRSPEFCRVLIDAYPESERIADATSSLPLHWACMRNTVATVEYLYKVYPDAINHAATNGHYPIHDAIRRMSYSDNATDKRRDPKNAIEIVKFLLECNSNVASQEDSKGRRLLIWACRINYDNSNLDADAAVELIKVICDACPEPVRNEDNNNGRLPLHYLCKAKTEDETVALEQLKFLVHRYPESIRHADNYGCLPIHLACMGKSPEFCLVLIEAYPGSERIADHHGALPLHIACKQNTVATVEYFYKLYPDAINHATAQGIYPIHGAIIGLRHRESPIAAVDIVQFLLGCDPTVKLQKFRGFQSLLHVACKREYTDSNMNAALQIIKTMYDAYPEAIEDNNIPPNLFRYHQRVRAFIHTQLVYARQAKDHLLMTTPDGNGQLPLHTALQNNVRLGSIKLLVKGNPSAIRNVDTHFALPLHVACQHHDSTSVIQYLLGLDRRTLRAVDYDDNTALHYACRGARHEIIGMLLEKYDAVSVSKRNAQNKLPVDLLWESNEEEDRESIAYTESVFRLLKTYPETLMRF